MPKSSNRVTQRLRLSVASARTVRIATAEAPPLLPWPVAAIGGGAVAGLAGAVLVTGVMLLAWLSAITVALPAVLGFAAQVWLLAHGGQVLVDGVPITVAPLLLSLLFAGLCASIGAFAFRQGRLSHAEQPSPGQLRRLVAGSIGQVALGYTGFAVLLAWTTAGAAGMLRPVVGAALISAGGAAIGVLLAAGWRLRSPLGRDAARGAAAGALGLIVAAAIVFGLALLLGETRIAALESAVGFDATGSVVWALIVVAYLPNLLGWAASWLLGAGFTVGTGSLVSVSTTQLGLLPAVPVFGALPPAGVAAWWVLGFLALGVTVGALAGVVAGSRQPELLRAVGAAALAGTAVAVGYLGWAAASRGNLGVLRMTELGPRLLESAVIGVPLLVFSAALAGLVAWFVRRRNTSG